MASTTVNLGMTLPAVSDPADIGALNENFKKIDNWFSEHGLGTDPDYVADANTCKSNGRFYIDENTANKPEHIDYAVLDVRRRNYMEYVQEVADVTRGLKAIRHCYDGTTWSEWAYENPPMALGVEYRTTERWNGKPVYTKLLNCGKAVNGGDVLLGLDRTCVIIRQAGTASDAGLVLPYGRTSTSQLSADLAVNSGVWHAYFAVSEGYDGKFDVYLQLWYTKE